MVFIIVIIIAIIIYIFQLRFYEHFWKKNLSVNIAYSQNDAFVGDKIELIEKIENRKALPLPVLYVKFSSSKTFIYDDRNNSAISDHYYRNDIFSISGNQQVIRKQYFTTTARGYFVIPSIDIVATDLFMTRNYACMYDNHAALYVYPKQIYTKDFIKLASAITGKAKQTTLYQDPFSFRSIREYFPTDTMSDMNWKASAKTGKLMVNTHFDSQNGHIVLLLNLDSHVTQRSYDLAECCISVAATMLSQFEKEGLSYKLAINMKDPESNQQIISDTGTGREHHKNLLRMLCRLDLHKELTDFTEFFKGESSQFYKEINHTIYVILSNYRKPTLIDVYGEKKQQGYHMYFICPERKEHMSAVPFVEYLEVEPDAI
ncbi:MAG: DUF58 domain-containing protein [Lachnospiraceae bacterium]